MFGFFSRKKKDFKALVNGDTEIDVQGGENLLAAGLRAGLAWPHDCRVGSCGECQCRLTKGKIKPLSDYSYVLDGDQLKSGMILACQAHLKSNIDVEVELDAESNAEEICSFEGTIVRITDLTHDTKEMVVKSNQSIPMRACKAGQYADVSYQGLKVARSYSFAKAPQKEGQDEVTFFVRHVPGGEFTNWLFDADRTNTPVTVEGPYGRFGLSDENVPMICIAGGSGLSAIKAILESAVIYEAPRDCLFLFGARTQKDLYCLKEMVQIEKEWFKDNTFKFVPVLSDEPANSDWKGATGLVTDYLRKAYIDTGKIQPAESQGYLCGPPGMIDAATDMLVESGMLKENVFFDKFLDASSIPGGR